MSSGHESEEEDGPPGLTEEMDTDEEEENSDKDEVIRHMRERLKFLKRRLSERRSGSVVNSTATTASSIKLGDVAKELLKLVPRYDGTGGIQKYIEYVNSFQGFAGQAELPALRSQPRS